MSKDYDDGYDFIKVAFKSDREDKAWQLWTSIYPNMDKENFISFEEFKNTIIEDEAEKENLTNEEILNKVNNIINLTIEKEV